MNYKKIVVGILLICCAWLIAWKAVRIAPANLRNNPPTSQKETQKQSNVTFIIDTGTTVATYDGIMAATAFDALAAVSNKHAISIEKKQYDFGVFVEKIGDLTNTKDNAWIYYVNGASGDVAADKKSLKDGDVVEWRYTKPMY